MDRDSNPGNPCRLHGFAAPELSQFRGCKTLLVPRLHVLQLVFGEFDFDAQVGIVSLCTT